MPATSRLSRRLAQDGQARQEQATRLANRAAVAVDRRIGEWWRALVKMLADPRGNWYEIGLMLKSLPIHARATTHRQLVRLACWARRSAVKQLMDVLPETYLEAVLENSPGVRLVSLSGHAQRGTGFRVPTGQPTELRFRMGNGGESRESSFAQPRGYQLMEDRSDHQEIADLIFPAPPLERTEAWVADLLDRLSFHGTYNRMSPEAMAEVVARGMASGKTHREIAKDLLPLANDVRASAMRTARTWGLYVASKEMEAVHDGLGDLMIGKQVHASLDRNTRSWHAERDKTIYYFDPGPGQKGMHQCPHPPLEAEDPGERPPDAPGIAWN